MLPPHIIDVIPESSLLLVEEEQCVGDYLTQIRDSIILKVLEACFVRRIPLLWDNALNPEAARPECLSQSLAEVAHGRIFTEQHGRQLRVIRLPNHS